MSGPRTTYPAMTVTRHYRVDETSCEEAVRRLLAFAKQKGPPPDKSGPEDAKGSENVSRRNHSTA